MKLSINQQIHLLIFDDRFYFIACQSLKKKESPQSLKCNDDNAMIKFRSNSGKENGFDIIIGLVCSLNASFKAGLPTQTRM